MEDSHTEIDRRQTMDTLTKTNQSVPQQATSSGTQLLLAWGLLFAVMLPRIIVAVFVGKQPDPFTAYFIPGNIVVLCALAATRIGSAVRPLRGYLLTCLGILAGYGIPVLIVRQAAFVDWANTLPLGLKLLVGPQAPVALRIITLLVVIATLVGSGLKRQDLFMAKGNLSAPVQREFLFQQRMPWWVQALLFLAIFSGGTALFMAMTTQYSPAAFAQVLNNLPFILLAATFNAFLEEFVFRSVMLARVIPVLGSQQANWLQATFFGLGHYFGNPSGPLGVLMSGAMGWALGKSILETRGFTIAWVLHFVQDAIIFTFFVMSLA
jgi:membrane protease YdiL (CAAX protease family)